jgi:hypothetical protein
MSNMHPHHPQLKWLSLCLLCGVAFLSISAATPVAMVLPAPPLAIAPPPPVPEPTLAELAVLRYEVATKGFNLAISGHQPTDAPGPEVIDWMRRRVRARLDLVEPKNFRVAFVKEYVELLKKEEAFEERMVKGRLHGVQGLLRAQYDRIEGEMLVKQIEAK